MERYDIAVIGTGPAGLEAAITATIRNKKVLLLGDNNLSKKVESAHAVLNYLGLPEVKGEDMTNAFKKHLKSLNIKITQDKANAIYSLGDYFAIQGHKDNYEAESIILATGVSLSKPFDGENENLGKGVSYCATCDGRFYKGKEVAVIAYSKENEEEADFLRELASKVTYIQMYEEENNLGKDFDIIKNVKPRSIEKIENRLLLHLEDRDIETDGIFILRDVVAPSNLVPGLKIENNCVVVDRSLNTNINGIFACGDITGAPYQYIKAAGEGNVAALSAVSYLAQKKAIKEKEVK